jgi:hypothetical protein
LLVDGLAEHQGGQLEVEPEAAVVEVGGGDDRQLVVDDHGLGVDEARAYS